VGPGLMRKKGVGWVGDSGEWGGEGVLGSRLKKKRAWGKHKKADEKDLRRLVEGNDCRAQTSRGTG